MSATFRQREYIETLARELHVPVPSAETFEDASSFIEDLLRRCPIRQGTSRAIHAMLRDSHWTREDLKLAVDTESFSPAKGCSEHQGQWALKLLKGEQVEVHRPVPTQATLVDQLVSEQQGGASRAPRRPPNPFLTPSGPDAAIRTPPQPQGRPGSALAIRKPGRPPDAIPGIDWDPETGATMTFRDEVPDHGPAVRSILRSFPGAVLVAHEFVGVSP